jgi:O-antigen/teichoic acid export membrane protein
VQASYRVMKNTGILYARMAITVLISLYTTRVLLGSLGTEDFGIFAVVGGAISMLGFLNASMASASQRFMSYAHGLGDESRQVQIFNVSCLLHLGIGICMVVTLEIIGFFFFDGFLNIDPTRIDVSHKVYHFVVISTFFTILSVPYDAVITARENMLFFAVLSMLESVCKLVIALFVSHTISDKLAVYGVLVASMMLLLFIVRVLFCHSRYIECQFFPRKHYSQALFKEMTSFGGWSLLGSASSMIAFYGQGIVLNKFFGTSVNAAQGVAGQLSGQVGALAMTMLRALNPMIVKSEGGGERKQMLNASMIGSKAGFFLLSILAIPAIVEMPNLLNFWLKDVPPYAVVFCRLLLLKSLVEQLYVTLAVSINAVGDIRNYQISTSLIHCSSLIISCVAFMHSYPAWTIYVIFLINSFVLLLVILRFAYIKCQLDILLYVKNVLLKCLFVFLITLLVLSGLVFLFKSGVTRLIFVFLLNFILLPIFIYCMGVTSGERHVVKSILSSLWIKISLIR